MKQQSEVQQHSESRLQMDETEPELGEAQLIAHRNAYKGWNHFPFFILFRMYLLLII